LNNQITHARQTFAAIALTSILWTAALAATGSSVAMAQEAKTIYYTTNYYHLDGAKRAEYLDYVKNTSSKYRAAWVKEVPEVRSFTISEVIYGGNPAPAWNLVITYVTDGPPKGNQAVNDAIFRKATGMRLAEGTAKLNSMWTLVGQVLSTREATEGSATLQAGDIIRTDYMKIADGRTGDYFNTERSDWEPLHAQRIKDGTMKGWRLTRVRVPGGDRMFDAQSSQIYSNLEQSLANPRYEQLVQKTTPDKSYATMLNRTQAARKIIRGEMRRVIFSVSK